MLGEERVQVEKDSPPENYLFFLSGLPPIPVNVC